MRHAMTMLCTLLSLAGHLAKIWGSTHKALCLNLKREKLLHELHVELQGRVGGDHAASTAGAVAQLRGDDQGALAAGLHGRDAL